MDVLRLTQHIRCGLTPLPFATLVPSVATSYMLGTINAHCCAARLQRRLSTAFAAIGHSALRPNPPARICQLPGPLGTIASITWLTMKTMADAILDIIDENNQVIGRERVSLDL
jgi:hypothetical protein